MELRVSSPPEHESGARAGNPAGPNLAFHHFSVLFTESGEPWLLGEGKFGKTYKAIDSRLHRFVALKVLRAELLESASAKEKFEQEARSAASLQHPNIAPIYYFGEQDGECFYAMEFVEGADLERHVAEHGPMSTEDALAIAAQVASALGVAHREGMVHRDVKPANIILGRARDGGLNARMIDFGLLASAASRISGFEGTPLYASPEQFDGSAPDARSDVYSLGAVLFFMLTGRPPFRGTFAEVDAQHSLEAPPLEELKALPAGIASLVSRLMEKNPKKRPQSGDKALAEIEHISRGIRGAASQTALEWMASRYASIEREGVVEGGTLYRVAQQRGEEEFSVLHLDRSEAGTVASANLRALFPLLRALKTPCVRRLLQLEETSDGVLAVLETLTGTRMLSVLRVRRSLPVSEALLVLAPLADAIDEAKAAGLPIVHLGLRDIYLQPVAEPSTPLGDWKYLRPVVDLLRVGDSSSGDVNATIAGSAERSLAVPSPEHPAAGADQIIAALAYEIVGGRTAPQAGYYFPLAELSESANAALRGVFQTSSLEKSARQVLAEIFPKIKQPSAALPLVSPPQRKFPASKLPLHPSDSRHSTPSREVENSPPPTGVQATSPTQHRFSLTHVWLLAAACLALMAVAGLIDIYFAGSDGRGAKSEVAQTAAGNSEMSTDNVRETAHDGDAEAQYEMGLRYRDGRGVLQDMEEAVRWLKKSAEQGSSRAKNALAMLHLGGRTTVESKVEDSELYRVFYRSAQEGNAEGQFQLANMYLNGIAVMKDRAYAAKYFKMAADQGHAGAKLALASTPQNKDAATRPKTALSAPPPAPTGLLKVPTAGISPKNPRVGEQVTLTYKIYDAFSLSSPKPRMPDSIHAGGMNFQLAYATADRALGTHYFRATYTARATHPGIFNVPSVRLRAGGESIKTRPFTFRVSGKSGTQGEMPPIDPAKVPAPSRVEQLPTAH